MKFTRLYSASTTWMPSRPSMKNRTPFRRSWGGGNEGGGVVSYRASLPPPPPLFPFLALIVANSPLPLRRLPPIRGELGTPPVALSDVMLPPHTRAQARNHFPIPSAHARFRPRPPLPQSLLHLHLRRPPAAGRTSRAPARSPPVFRGWCPLKKKMGIREKGKGRRSVSR
jgi:hypothetical protein